MFQAEGRLYADALTDEQSGQLEEPRNGPCGGSLVNREASGAGEGR